MPKIRDVKNQLDNCLKQQVRLKEEVQASKGADTVSMHPIIGIMLTFNWLIEGNPRWHLGFEEKVRLVSG